MKITIKNNNGIIKRCLRCGGAIIISRLQVYCQLCKKQRLREIDRKWREKQKQKLLIIKKNIKSYIGQNTCYDSNNKPFVDNTHANWDTFIIDGVCIKYLGTVSERDLDKRIYRLQQEDEEVRKWLKKQKQKYKK